MNSTRRDLLKLGMASTIGGYLGCEPAHAAQAPFGSVQRAPYYPQSHATSKPIDQMLDDIIRNNQCASFYLDTREGHSNNWLSEEGQDHHQGLARTHKLSDGSIYFFLTHSELDSASPFFGRPRDSGELMQFRYVGPISGSHVVETRPLTVASLTERLHLNEQHPSDLVFLGDVNNSDSGYLFVTENNGLMVYYWARGAYLEELGFLPGLNGAVYVFLDRAGDTYYLGISNAWKNDGELRLYTAKAERLFPVPSMGHLDMEAFVQADSLYPMPHLGQASQIKLIRDSLGAWYLLGFRSHPWHDPNGTDYVDVYRVQFAPFRIWPRRHPRHIVFKSGDTGFASTGTHYVEETGRLLLLSSYRWSEDQGPGESAYVSRVDELTAGPRAAGSSPRPPRPQLPERRRR